MLFIGFSRRFNRLLDEFFGPASEEFREVLVTHIEFIGQFPRGDIAGNLEIAVSFCRL